MPASAQREREKICVPHRDSSRMYCVMSGDDAGSVRVCARRRPSRGTHRSALRGLPQPTGDYTVKVGSPGATCRLFDMLFSSFSSFRNI